VLKAFLRRSLGHFEKQWNYDAGYMNDLVDASPWTFLRFGLVASLGHTKGPPAEAMTAARIAGTLSEDCGPCTQISVDMATAQGVKPEVIRAILVGDRFAMGETAALGYGFARAVLDRDLEGADAAREEITRRWGKRAVVALSLALTTARMYPNLKYGLGHGRSCTRVIVAGAATPFSFAEPVAV